MLFEPLVDAVNAAGHTVHGAVSTFLSVNYVLADNLLLVASFLLGQLLAVASALLRGIRIGLEDLIVFGRETLESVVFACECVFALFDQIGLGLFFGYERINSALGLAVDGVASVTASFVLAVTSAVAGVVHWFSLLGANYLQLLELVPWTIRLMYRGSIHLALRTASSARALADQCVTWINDFPLLAVFGFAFSVSGCGAIFYLVRKWARHNNHTPRSLLATAGRLARGAYLKAVESCVNFFFAGVDHFYLGLLFIHALYINLVNKVKRVITRTRPRHIADRDFHQLEPYDPNDEGESERATETRQRYEQLLEKVGQIKAGKAKAKSKAKPKRGRPKKKNEDVETQLLEQVEREREDKLCVVCRENEKCIMMLPCRHLCICQRCDDILDTEFCPMCRNRVVRVIKAYL